MVDFAKLTHGMSIRGACQVFSISRTVYRYQPDKTRDEPVIKALQELAERYPRYGFGKMFPILRRHGHKWNHKRVYRVYCELKFNMRRKGKKRLPNRNPEPLSVPDSINQCWSIDFMSDALYGGRRFRTLNVLDEGVREGLAIEVDTSLPAERLIRVLGQVISWRGTPQALRVDNGPELLADKFLTWCEKWGIQLRYIQPGRPAQNAFIERFNRTYRTEVLNAYVFESLEQVQEISSEWLRSYNEERPHEALAGVPPATYRAQLTVRSSPLPLSP